MVKQKLFAAGMPVPAARRGWGAVALSAAAQSVVCGCALTLPLLWPESLPLVEASVKAIQFSTPTLRPELRKPPPIPLPARPDTALAAPSEAVAATDAPALGVKIGREAPGTMPIDPAPGAWPGMGSADSSTGSPFGSGTAPSGPVVALAHPVATGLPRVSQGVSQGLLLTPIQPIYPKIAITAGVAGTVIVSARIDRDGRVIGASATSGPPMLRQAAVEAVSAAKYRPYLLNGEPTEVFTTYTVTFRLGS